MKYIIVFLVCISSYLLSQGVVEDIILFDTPIQYETFPAKSSDICRELFIGIYINSDITSDSIVEASMQDVVHHYDTIGFDLTFEKNYISIEDTLLDNSLEAFYAIANAVNPSLYDINLLVSQKVDGGIGAVQQLGQRWNFAVAGLLEQTPPTCTPKEWNNLVISHEIGHVIGSMHEHDCVWNGDNTALNNCVYFDQCRQETPILSGGTMGYCHLIGRLSLKWLEPVKRQLWASYDAFRQDNCNIEIICKDSVEVVIVFDERPDDIYWTFGDRSSPSYDRNILADTLTLCPSDCDTLTIYDKYGDGLWGQCFSGFILYEDEVIEFGGSSVEIPICKKPDVIPCIYLDDFELYYGQSSQDTFYTTSSNFATLSQNTWLNKRIDYFATNNSYLRFEIKSDQVVDIQGIAVAEKLNPFIDRSGIFNVLGDQEIGTTLQNYPLNVWNTVEVKLSPGQKNYLFLIHDNDRRRGGTTQFKNLCIYEKQNVSTEETGLFYNILGQPSDMRIPGIYFNQKEKRVVIPR